MNIYGNIYYPTLPSLLFAQLPGLIHLLERIKKSTLTHADVHACTHTHTHTREGGRGEERERERGRTQRLSIFYKQCKFQKQNFTTFCNLND